ncbi:MAG: TolB family protein [Actinomycetota bacterium]
MSDLQDVLDREARRISAEPDALEAVLRRVDRRRQNRRVATAVFALILAAVAMSTLVKAFARSEPNPAGPPGITDENVDPPRNGRIVFTRFICQKTCTDSTPILSQQIVVADPNGENETVLVNEPGDTVFAFLSANWSPDGTTVIFARNTCGNSSGSGPSGIWSVDGDGSDLHQLIQAPAGACFGQGPTFTPDGRRIVVEVAAEGSGDSLWIMNSDGTGLVPLTTEPAGFADESPQVSPDGTRVVFGRCSGRDCQQATLATVDIDGGNLRLLPPTPLAGSGEPNWSPDSKKIVFSLSNGVTSDIATINADGSGSTQLTFSNPDTEGSWQACYSPDGTEILFIYSRYREGEVVLDELFAMNTDGTQRRVTHTVSEEFAPQWAVAAH